MRAGAATLALLPLIALALPGHALRGYAAGGEEWRTISTEEGITVEARRETGSSLETIRARAHSTTPPGRVFATVWNHREYAQFVPYLKHLEILRETSHERILYEQIGMPVISDRDCVVLARVDIDESSGVRRLLLESTTDPAKPETPGFVRVKTIRGGWTIRPATDGGSDILYEMFTDPGGSVPAWVVKLAQREAPANLVGAMIRRAARAP